MKDIYRDDNCLVFEVSGITTVVLYIHAITLDLPTEEMAKLLTSLAKASVELTAITRNKLSLPTNPKAN